MMRVAIGIQNFEDIRINNYYYIDKTSFIKEWWESGDSVTLITRPRRFGKTLNMSMLECFFSPQYANRGDLFEGLSIWTEEKYQNLQGTYPVISLSFSDIKEKDFEGTRKKICELFVELYEKYSFLKESGMLTERELDYFNRIKKDMDDTDATLAIKRLSNYLRRYYKKRAIILLDEYDTPMQEAYEKGYWEELVAFTRSLFNSTFKANTDMERGIMTGITRVSKESIFSDLNHLKVVTTTSNEYATVFGFTEQEVFQALDEFGLGEEKEEVKRWYNGFVFGDCSDIYNPWSILNFLDTKNYDTYWANTSSSKMINRLVREADIDIKELFEQLLKGETIYCPIDEQIVYNQLDENEASIWSLLLASGYLKVLCYEDMALIDVSKEPLYELALTNYEVHRMFYSMVRSWFQPAKRHYNGFIKAMLSGNRKEMNLYMNEVALQTFSYFDGGKRPSKKNPERFYHGFVLGLIVELREEYIITSNRESGFGRYDIMIEPRNIEKNAIIMEFKIRDAEEEETLKDTVKAALAQIEKEQYETNLIMKGIKKENIYKYGFAFQGKNVLIG